METERFNLRLVTLEDKDEIYNILKKDEVVTNLNMNKINNMEDIINLLKKYNLEHEKGTYEPFAIIDKNNDNFVGVFLLKIDLYNDDAYEYTTYIAPEYWNKGISTEVLKYMIKYFFEKYNQNNFRGYVMEKNIASSKVLEKCNFDFEKKFKVNGIDGEIISYLMTRNKFMTICGGE